MNKWAPKHELFTFLSLCVCVTWDPTITVAPVTVTFYSDYIPTSSAPMAASYMNSIQFKGGIDQLLVALMVAVGREMPGIKISVALVYNQINIRSFKTKTPECSTIHVLGNRHKRSTV